MLDHLFVGFDISLFAKFPRQHYCLSICKYLLIFLFCLKSETNPINNLMMGHVQEDNFAGILKLPCLNYPIGLQNMQRLEGLTDGSAHAKTEPLHEFNEASEEFISVVSEMVINFK